MKRQGVEVLATVLEEKYTHAQQALAQAEEALRDFRVRTATAPAVAASAAA